MLRTLLETRKIMGMFPIFCLVVVVRLVKGTPKKTHTNRYVEEEEIVNAIERPSLLSSEVPDVQKILYLLNSNV